MGQSPDLVYYQWQLKDIETRTLLKSSIYTVYIYVSIMRGLLRMHFIFSFIGLCTVNWRITCLKNNVLRILDLLLQLKNWYVELFFVKDIFFMDCNQPSRYTRRKTLCLHYMCPCFKNLMFVSRENLLSYNFRPIHKYWTISCTLHLLLGMRWICLICLFASLKHF